MVHRLEIATRPDLPDPRGASIAATVRAFLGVPVARVRTRDVHRIEADLSEDDARRAEEDIQKLTDKRIADIDHALADKEADLLKI